MKRFTLVAISLLFAGFMAVSASAQAPAQPAAAPRIAVIDTTTFDSKDGIKKYIIAMDALEKEFAPLNTEIQGLVTRYTSLGAEIKKLQDAAGAPTPVPFDQKTAQAKVDEYQGLEVTIKRKQEDGKARFEKRRGEVLGPLMQDIGKAMDEYAKQKGYALMLDIGKMYDSGILLTIDPSKLDVTKDFIIFYNARPAGSAANVTPK
ncbi:MAG: OmpH family outer membrane protein [Acidobacteriota bacterium]